MGREFCNRKNSRSATVESLFSSSWYLIAVARPQWEWGNILTSTCIGNLQGKLGANKYMPGDTIVINLSLFTQICMAIISFSSSTHMHFAKVPALLAHYCHYCEHFNLMTHALHVCLHATNLHVNLELLIILLNS